MYQDRCGRKSVFLSILRTEPWCVFCLCEQGGAGHRPEGYLLQDQMRVNADAVAGLQQAGGQRQPGLLGSSRHGAALLHDLHLRPVQGEQHTVKQNHSITSIHKKYILFSIAEIILIQWNLTSKFFLPHCQIFFHTGYLIWASICLLISEIRHFSPY